MRLADLEGRGLVVLGLGIDNRSILDIVSNRGPTSIVVAVDDVDSISDDDRSLLADRGIEPVPSADLHADADAIVIRAPGYPRWGPVATSLERSGARFTTAVDLWFGEHGADRTVVGVTGTKGKSSVTSLLDALWERMGVEHVTGGNIGIPIWAAAPAPAPGCPAVVEVSSYMAVDAATPPTIGVLTSLEADHVSWHGSVDAYRRDKLRLFTGGRARPETVVVPERASSAVAALEKAGLSVTPVDAEDPRFDAAGESLSVHGFPPHQRSNLALAVVAAERAAAAMGGPRPEPAQWEGLAEDYRGLPSRHAVIPSGDGRRWIDDALASNPFAAAAAVDSVGDRPLTWILGGQSRDVDLGPLDAALSGRRAATVVIGIPDTGHAWTERLRGVGGVSEVRTASSIGDAVTSATGCTPKGGVVLFAPAAPTPPAEGTYRDRAASFAEAVRHLAGT